jgi:multiple antibiotic resistance protein
MAKLVLSSFVMLAVTVGPLSAAVVFVGLTAGATDAERRAIAIRGVSIATVVLVLFALGGGRFLDLLQVSTAAFQLAGGLLLTLAAIDLILARPSGLSSITPAESREAQVTPDIAVFPLAIPLIAGPGAMTAVVLLMQHAGTGLDQVAIMLVLLVIMAVTAICLLGAPRFLALLGVTGVNVVSRVFGILLAALAMQMILDGLRLSGVFGAPS